MGACSRVCLRVDVQCSMASFCWLMIPQPPLSESGSEVGTKKQNSVFAPATPLQSGCPWQHHGGLCQFWATSVQGLLWVQKNVKGGDLETFPQLRKNGCPPSALPRSLSCSLFQHTEKRQKSAMSNTLRIYFFSLSRQSLHPLVATLSLPNIAQ